MGCNLAIIEKNKLFRIKMTYRISLKQLSGKYPGFEEGMILEAGGFDETDRIFDRNSIDVAILGIDGLQAEGVDIMKMIRSKSPLTEIILLNSSDHIQLSINCMKLGAFHEFIIPFEIDSLVDKIIDAWNRKKEKTRQFYTPA